MLNHCKECTDRILRNGQNAESLQGVDRVLNHCREWMEYAECRWWVDYCRASVCVGGGVFDSMKGLVTMLRGQQVLYTGLCNNTEVRGKFRR